MTDAPAAVSPLRRRMIADMSLRNLSPATQRSYLRTLPSTGHLSKTGKPRATAIDRRTTRHPGYAISQCCRKRIEEVFGWIKGSAGLTKVKLRGRAKVDAVFTLALAAYNLIRLPKLLGAPA